MLQESASERQTDDAALREEVARLQQELQTAASANKECALCEQSARQAVQAQEALEQAHQQVF